jgi:serine phosphatase RsbU (regulator of sigma subunit)
MSSENQIKFELDRLKSAVAELTLLNELALAAGGASDPDELLDLIIQKSIKAVRAEQGSLMLVTPQSDQPLKTLVRQEDFSGSISSYKVGSQITGWVLKNKKPLRIDNLAQDDRFSLSADESQNIRTVMCVPVLARGKLIGVLIMTNKKTGEAFSDDDLRLLSIIAAQSGQLIRNAELQTEATEKKKLEHEMDLARRIQLELLPESDPKSDFLEIASLFRPHAAVGGDYYDYIELDTDKTGIVVADVSGHGPSAALLMSMIKGVLHSVAENFSSSQKAMDQMNKIVSQIIPSDMFITMLLLVFDRKQKMVEYCNAGHPPLLYFNKKNDSASPVDLRGCAVNLSPTYVYEQKNFEFHTGDTFLVYTDGIIETTDNLDNMYGVDQLLTILREQIAESPRNIIAHIENKLTEFGSSQSPDDDRVAIVIRVI